MGGRRGGRGGGGKGGRTWFGMMEGEEGRRGGCSGGIFSGGVARHSIAEQEENNLLW